jgi:hypothetical protein
LFIVFQTLQERITGVPKRHDAEDSELLAE